MTFFSSAFILFVTAVCLLYFLVPCKFRWIVLLAASYFFYWINSQWLLLIHIFTALYTFGIGIWIERINISKNLKLNGSGQELSREEKKAIRAKTKKKTDLVLTLGIVIDLGILLFLKYWNFFTDQVNPLLKHFGSSVPKLSLLLPLGISFYTLQAIAYMIDISRGKNKADRNPFRFMLFMSFFPQIVQGPISRHGQLAAQLYEGHSFDFQRMGFGIQLMLWGWFKKLVVADRIGIAVKNVIDVYPGTFQGPIVFFAFALYGIQIYTDFSGGMDIAAGFAEILGINMEKNFNQPYFSRSVEEFWRRWHITLGSWMRDYIFYSLSLSKTFTQLGKKTRKLFGASFGKKLPAFLSMFIVYFLVGIWHGSSYKYIAYGIWNGVFIMGSIMLEEVYEKVRRLIGIDENSFGHRSFQMLRTFVIISFGRYFSRSLSLKYALRFFYNTFINRNDYSFLLNGSLKKLGLDTANWILLGLSIIILLFVDYLHEHDIHIRRFVAKQHIAFRWFVYWVAIMAILIFGIYGPAYDAASFIYQNF